MQETAFARENGLEEEPEVSRRALKTGMSIAAASPIGWRFCSGAAHRRSAEAD